MALILGSRAGALSRSQELSKDLAPYSTHSLAAMKETEQFSTCYTLLRVAKKRIGREDLGIQLKQLIKDIDFSMSDDFMAEIVKQKIFRVIINSNIDDILHDACIESGLKENDDFINFDIGHYIITDSIDEIVHHPERKPCKIVNLYNDVDAFVYSLDQTDDVQAISSRSVKKLLDGMRIDTVLIIGMDLKWDHIILSALPSRIKTVWFINEDEQVKEDFCAKYERLEQFSFITGEQWGYEKVLRALYFQINPATLPRHYEFVLEVREHLKEMGRNLKNLKKRLTSLEKEVVLTQRQIMELSRRVDDAIKHGTEEI